MKVLVVDDDEIICRNIISKLKRITEERNMVCEMADSVAEAKIIIRSFMPDIVITDLNMPGVSGLKLIRYVTDNYPDISTYVLSGYDDYELVRQAFLNGAKDYLLKPLEIDELREKVLKEKPDDSAAENVRDNSNSQMEKAVQYIEDNLSRDIAMNELASSMGMSYAYFSRKFKEYTGYGFAEYMNKKRIERSKIYLMDSCCKVMDIAYKVGYSSSFIFSKTFKKYEGCYPTEYRNRNQK